jgi:hypothetical protein
MFFSDSETFKYVLVHVLEHGTQHGLVALANSSAVVDVLDNVDLAPSI